MDAEEKFFLFIGGMMGLIVGMICGVGLVNAGQASAPEERYECAVSEWNSSQLECTVAIHKTEKILIDKDSPLARQIISK